MGFLACHWEVGMFLSLQEKRLIPPINSPFHFLSIFARTTGNWNRAKSACRLSRWLWRKKQSCVLRDIKSSAFYSTHVWLLCWFTQYNFPSMTILLKNKWIHQSKSTDSSSMFLSLRALFSLLCHRCAVFRSSGESSEQDAFGKIKVGSLITLKNKMAVRH